MTFLKRKKSDHPPIEGHFVNGAFLYDKVFDLIPGQSRIVELGCFLGKSTHHMVSLIKESRKKIDFHVVDIFSGEAANDGTNYLGRDFFREFCDNMEIRGNTKYIETHRMSTVEAAPQFKDNSCDFVYVDADHHYENVRQDIQLWYPKVKVGGYIGGDDWQKIGVRQAVVEAFLNEPSLSDEQAPDFQAWSNYKFDSFELVFRNQWLVKKGSE